MRKPSPISSLEPAEEDCPCDSALRVLGEASASVGHLMSRRRAILQGIAEEIVANDWVWTVGSGENPGSWAGSAVLQTNSAEGGEVRWDSVLGKVPSRPIREFLKIMDSSSESRNVTYTGECLFPEVLGKRIVAPGSPDGMEPVLVSCYVTDAGEISAAFFRRTLGSINFAEKDVALVDLLLGRLRWFHDRSWPAEFASKAGDLTPRLRSVLQLLLEGRGRKQIADALGISVDTLHGYIKQIYSDFGVHSQGELMGMFYVGP